MSIGRGSEEATKIISSLQAKGHINSNNFRGAVCGDQLDIFRYLKVMNLIPPTCQATVGRQFACSWPTVGQHLGHCLTL